MSGYSKLLVKISFIFFLCISNCWGYCLTVTSPSAGENWKTTQTYTIRWTTTSTKPYVNIYLNKNISNRVYTIASSVPNNGQYVWTIPADTLMNKDDEGYTYYLAVCTDDCCPDGQNFGIFFPIPSAPTWFTSTAESSNSIKLAWGGTYWGGVYGATGYEVYDCNTNILVERNNDWSYTGTTIKGLDPNTYYNFKMRTINSSGSSAFTACQGATTLSGALPTPPSTPTGFTANALSAYSISLSWGGIDGVTSYDVYTCGGAFVTSVANNSCTISGLTPNTTYSYKVLAKNSAGSSGFTSCQSATTPDAPRTGLQASESVRTTNWNTTYSNQYQKPCSQYERYCGDPVETSTGAQILEYSLLTVQGVIPISFNLAYNSLVLDEGPAGKGWGFNYGFGARIEEIAGDIKVHWASNRSNRFNPQGSGIYTSVETACRYDKLVKNTDGTYTLTMQDKTVYKFNSAGKLIELRNPKNQSLTFAYDASGRLSKITEPISGVFLNYAYNTQGLLSIVSDPLNRQVNMGYDANRNLTTITDPKGHITTFTYNALGQTLTAVNAEGNLLFSNTYDAKGRIIAQDDGISTNQLIRLSYDENSQPGKVITTITDRNGNTQVFTFDANYQMLEKKDELGNISAKYTYDDKGNRISATDGNAHATQFGYDAAGQMISLTDAAGNISRMTYDSNGNLISATDALGKQSTFAYDSQNNLITATDPQGNITRYTYNANGQVLTVTSPAGNITTYQYAKGLPAKIIEPENTSRAMEYDAAGRLIRFADAEGNAYLLTYDDSCAGSCRAQTITDPLGNIVHMSYDSRGNMLIMTDPKGSITRFTYDANGHRVSVINALNQTSRFEYDGEGRMIRVIDAKGNAAQVSYDAKGRVIRMTDALGNSRNIGYDKTNNVKTQTDALGRVVLSAAYSVSDNPSSMSDALGNTVKFEYDALQRLTKTIDGLNRATQFQYDVLGRLVMSTDAGGGQSSQAFDKESNLTGFKDPNANQTGFAFDKNGRMISETSASGSVVRYTYNARNLLAQFTNARGQNRQFEYDKAGRISRITDPDGTISYTYDANGNVLTVSDAVGTISREYDALNRVVRYTDVRGNLIQYGYDEVGNLAVLTYPDAKKVSYAYDALNRMISVTDWAGRLTRYEYDANSNLTRSVRPNGSIITYSYNTAGQLIQQKDVTATGVLIAQYDFTYDAAGNIVEEKVSPAPEPFVMQPVNMTYTSANRIEQYNKLSSDYFSNQPITHDADGNMTFRETHHAIKYSFDSRNRLIERVEGPYCHYTYDAENNRIKSNIDGEIEHRYIVNPEAGLSQVLVKSSQRPWNEDGGKIYYVYGLGLIGQEYQGIYDNYHFDLRGSTVALTNQQGEIFDRFQYGPYGEIVKPTETLYTPFLYNGRDGVMTDNNGLYYMRARYYDPTLKRFINQDVLRGNIGNGQSLNRYAYVNGNPVSYVDPLGLAKTMNRPLSFLQPTYILQTRFITPKLNYALDYLNAEGAHEHIFFNDGRNIGFSEHGFFSDSKQGFFSNRTNHDDNIMKLAAIMEARSVINQSKPYSLLGWGEPEKYNCQDYASNVRSIYNQIKNKELYPAPGLLENTNWLNAELDRITHLSVKDENNEEKSLSYKIEQAVNISWWNLYLYKTINIFKWDYQM